MTAEPDGSALGGVRGRTRTAIVEAAVTMWARDFSASVAEIAARAEVSRSTLHRYFPDRQSLIDAALGSALTCLEDDVGARVDEDQPAARQLEHLIRALIDNSDRVIFLFSDPARFADNPQWDNQDDDTSLEPLVRAAQAEGDLDPEVEISWIVATMYSLVYIAAEAIENQTMSRHEAQDRAVRTFLRGLAPA